MNLNQLFKFSHSKFALKHLSVKKKGVLLIFPRLIKENLYQNLKKIHYFGV